MTRHNTAIPPDELSIPELFHERVERSPSAPAFQYFDHASNQWNLLSWRQMESRVSHWRAGFKNEGLHRGDRVAIMLPNGINWACFDLAAQSNGLVVVPLYANDRPDNVAFILKETESKLLLCSSFSFWDELARLKGHESLNRIVLTEGISLPPEDLRIISLDDWLPESGGIAAHQFPHADELATIVYTSGTTGRPKGVMLSHRNILENSAGGLTSIQISPDDRFLSFLPLSHMLERTAGYYLPMMAGASITYARSIQDLGEDLLSVRPTVLVAVPRIFEKLHSKITIQISRKSTLTRYLFDLARDIGWRYFLHRQGRGRWSPDFILQPLLQILVGHKIQNQLGGNLRIVISGGAPLSLDIAKTLIGLGIPIYQGYGLTETSPVISVNRIEDNRPDGVGTLLPGIEAQFSPDGELQIRGPCVMQGYWQNPEATAAVINHDGWFSTGDVASLEDNHLKITGRLKDILVLSNSEKVSPTDIETAISHDPLFEQSMIVGEGRPYLTLLAVLNSEMWLQLAERLNISAEESSLTHDEVRAEIMRRVENCLRNFPGFAWVKNVSLSLNPWTVEQGLLTPTMKLKRRSILNLLNDEIERMYQN